MGRDGADAPMTAADRADVAALQGYLKSGARQRPLAPAGARGNLQLHLRPYRGGRAARHGYRDAYGGRLGDVTGCRDADGGRLGDVTGCPVPPRGPVGQPNGTSRSCSGVFGGRRSAVRPGGNVSSHVSRYGFPSYVGGSSEERTRALLTVEPAAHPLATGEARRPPAHRRTPHPLGQARQVRADHRRRPRRLHCCRPRPVRPRALLTLVPTEPRPELPDVQGRVTQDCLARPASASDKEQVTRPAPSGR